MPDFPIANILGRRPILITADAVIAAMRERFDDVSASLMLPTIEGKRGFALWVDGIPVVPIFEDFGLGLDELKPWHGRLRDADGPLLDNAAHVAVASPHRYEGREATLRASMAVLRVASVISERPGAHAVLWSLAESLTPAPAFRAEIARTSEHDAPIEVLSRIGQLQAGTEGGKSLIGVWAMGLAPFVGRDVEFVPKPLPAYQLFNALASAVNWLILKGPVFKDGDTFGVSATERIRVHHRDRGTMVRTRVLLMDIETLDPGAARFAN